MALSGGADSVLLLLLLWAHWPERRSRWLALHFDHRLRGRASTADARFCAGLAGGLGVTFEAGRWDRAPHGRRVSEAEARTARQAFFNKSMKTGRAGALWLGHQMDDVAETMLMRLPRGSGTAGLAAPRAVQSMAGGRVHLRPLLTLTKTEIVTILRQAGVPWREDATNGTDAYLRNRVRAEVLPAWQAAMGAGGRNVLVGVALARERLQEDDDALEGWLAQLAPLNGRGALNLGVLAGKPAALWRRALHRWLVWHQPDTDLSRSGFEVLLAAVQKESRGRFSLGKVHFAVWRRGELLFEKGIRRTGTAR